MATVKYEAVATVGTRKDGKKNYVRIGTVFETDKGLSLKLDSIPAGNEWNGWVSFFDPKPREDRQSTPKAASSRPSASSDDGSEIPF